MMNHVCIIMFIEIGVWIEFWTYWVYAGISTWKFSWVLICRLAAPSLPPGDDENSGTMLC